MNLNEALTARAKKIKLLVLDVDGVMTDGGLGLSDDGLEHKVFNSLDGLGMKLLKETGVQVAIITGRTSEIVKKRAQNTGVEHYYQGVENKLEALEDLLKKAGLTLEQSAFMGDDIIDAPPMLRCGLAFTVPSAHHMLKPHAHYVTRAPAGRGAVREVCEMLMQAQGTFDAVVAPYFKL